MVEEGEREARNAVVCDGLAELFKPSTLAQTTPAGHKFSRESYVLKI
jgi:hypothetical protein